jgi:hypothetical protein
MPMPLNIGTGRALLSQGVDLRALVVTLTTTHVGTFNPTMIKTGALPIWADDQGNTYAGLTPSFVYGSAGTKTITVTSSDGWAGLSLFRANSLNLTGISANFAALWASVTTFECRSSTAFTFDIAALADWRPAYFSANSTAISGDIAALAAWRPAYFFANSTAISGDIAALAAWRPSVFRAYSTAVTCSGAGGAQMYASFTLQEYQIQFTQIDTTGINAIVVDLYNNRAVSNTRTINISSVPGVLSADSVARIEGTGAYAGDGIKRTGVTVTYTAP